MFTLMPWGGMLLSECRSPEITFLIRAIYLAMVDSVRLLPVYFVPSCFNPSADHKTIPQIRNRIGQSQCVPASQVDVNRPSSAVRNVLHFLLYLFYTLTASTHTHPPQIHYYTHTDIVAEPWLAAVCIVYSCYLWNHVWKYQQSGFT